MGKAQHAKERMQKLLVLVIHDGPGTDCPWPAVRGYPEDLDKMVGDTSQETWIQVSAVTELQSDLVGSLYLSEPQLLCIIWFSATICWGDAQKGKWSGFCCLRFCLDRN